MKAEWETYEIGQLCSRLSSGKNLSAKQIMAQGKCPVFGGNGIRGYSSISNFDGECAIIGRQGANCGNVRFYSGQAYMTEHAVVLCANDNNNTRFLSYLISTLNLGHLSSQSAQPGLAVATIGKQEICVPDLTTQRKIASILSALDDKIALNQKINANLQAQAAAVFEWLLAEASEYCCVADIADLNPKRDLSKGVEARCIDMSSLSTSGNFPDSWEMRQYNGGMKFRNGDTIMARITPCLENGKAAYIDFLDEGETAFGSTEYIVLSPKEGYPAEFLYCLVRNKTFIDYATVHMSGTSGRQRVSADVIGKYERYPMTN